MAAGTIIITGANGQIGTELALALHNKGFHVVATDLNIPQNKINGIAYETLDVLDENKINALFQTHKPEQVYHLAALLSATAERKPKLAWEINMNGLLNILEAATSLQGVKVFYPSTIAVFGNSSPKINTPQYTVTEPSTIYGISKLAGERWCEYYFSHKNLDVRSMRYPGLISHKTKPGGGTTDYAIEMLFEAVENGFYTSYIDKGTRLPMMYMPDAIRGTIALMDAEVANIKVRSGYNFAAFSFTPEELALEIKKHIPDFKIDFKPDFRQQIAESWPQSIEDTAAQNEWGWKPEFKLSDMVKDMIVNIRKNYCEV